MAGYEKLATNDDHHGCQASIELLQQQIKSLTQQMAALKEGPVRSIPETSDTERQENSDEEIPLWAKVLQVLIGGLVVLVAFVVLWVSLLFFGLKFVIPLTKLVLG